MDQLKGSKVEFDFVGKIPFFGTISAVLFVAMSLYLIFKGLPYGIDFVGGTELQIQFSKDVPIGDLRVALGTLGAVKPSVQEYGDAKNYLIRFQLPISDQMTPSEINKLQNETVDKIKNLVTSGSFQENAGEVVRVDSVGPQVGQELKRSGVLAVFYSLLLILIYIAMRFDYKFSPGAVLCLIHDVVITLGVYALSGREINVPVIAAVLTLIGYSLNDTIVVFDRIRETEQGNPKLPFKAVINRALNEMWQRTVVTSGTTLVVGVALLFVTQGAISDIALILTVGIVVGTYSSIYIASPLTLWLDQWLGRHQFDIFPKPKFSDS
ncbi:MAG: protein translocase subunit SecF [Bdellovibrionaceae bacterium]|nr:protein translocase subunit SecF [Pseudobdellovibrionaceae bacterium]MDW8190625.1 protein translocase subunit SecF [Pseudobdellovibrionaceae bacterium]